LIVVEAIKLQFLGIYCTREHYNRISDNVNLLEKNYPNFYKIETLLSIGAVEALIFRTPCNPIFFEGGCSPLSRS
jgi:hypothetical protein